MSPSEGAGNVGGRRLSCAVLLGEGAGVVALARLQAAAARGAVEDTPGAGVARAVAEDAGRVCVCEGYYSECGMCCVLYTGSSLPVAVGSFCPSLW